MSAVAADTHALVWYLTKPERLSADARIALDGATAADQPIYVSTMSLVEMCFLVEKGKLEAEVLRVINAALDSPTSPFVVVSVDILVARFVPRIPRAAVRELPDRIIAATAAFLQVPLVTRDLSIQASGIRTIW